MTDELRNARSKKYALRRDTLLLKRSLVKPIVTHIVSQTRTLPSRLIFQQQDAKNPSIPYSPLKCWTCNQTGHKKLNCPQAICFFCGRPGHLKRICLDYRLAKIYDQEKRKSSHSLLHRDKAVKKRYSEDGTAYTLLFSLDNPSDISFEDPSHEPPEATRFLSQSDASSIRYHFRSGRH